MELEPLHTSRESMWDNTEQDRTQRHTFERTSIKELAISYTDESQSPPKLHSKKRGWVQVSGIYAVSRHKMRSVPQKHITAGALLLISILTSSVLMYLTASNGVDTRWLGPETSDVDCDLIKANGVSITYSLGITMPIMPTKIFGTNVIRNRHSNTSKVDVGIQTS